MTDVALREYLERRIEDMDRRYADRLQSMDQALTKAEHSLREYKAASNEWRDALKDSNNRMATRTELATLDLQVQDLRRMNANLEGRRAILVVVVSTAISVLFWALSKAFQ